MMTSCAAPQRRTVCLQTCQTHTSRAGLGGTWNHVVIDSSVEKRSRDIHNDDDDDDDDDEVEQEVQLPSTIFRLVYPVLE